LLQPDRDSAEAIEEIRREVGSHIFAAQFQQDPTPADGNMIKASWLGRHENLLEVPKFRRIVLSCDPAGKAHAHNDFTAVTVCGVDGKSIHVLHATREHWTVMQMKDRIISLAAQWKADLILVEYTSSGMGLIQLLREQPRLNVVGRHPKADKETRMARHQGRFEAGRVLLPKEAPWLAELESELLAFPNGRYDDQVDALLQFLDWYSQNESYINPIIVAPIAPSKTRPAPGHCQTLYAALPESTV